MNKIITLAPASLIFMLTGYAQAESLAGVMLREIIVE